MTFGLGFLDEYRFLLDAEHGTLTIRQKASLRGNQSGASGKLISGTNLFDRRGKIRKALADLGKKTVFIFADEADEGLIAGLFEGGGPQNHFGEDGRQAEAFRREGINLFTTIGGIGRGCDDAVIFEASEAVSENVGRDALVRIQKFLESAVAEQHHVANDE